MKIGVFASLDRNIGTQYYYRLLHSPKKEAVIAEMKEKTAAEPKHQFELLKSPIVAEFLGFRTEDSFAESDLESANFFLTSGTSSWKWERDLLSWPGSSIL